MSLDGVFVRGITGFGRVRDADPIPTLSGRQQTMVAWSIARSFAPDRCAERAAGDPYRPFARYRILGGGQDCCALLHNYVRVCALVPSDWDCLNPAFPDIDRPATLDAAIEPWRLLRGAELRAPPPDALVERLPACELKQVRYWKPATIGELIFNWWD